jgi:DNA-binding SARP family transcriptional activator
VAGASLLASGFAALWAYRRRRRDGKVRPGQAVPPPDPSLVPLHTAIRLTADSDWPTRLDAALRSLAAPHARAEKGEAPAVQVLLRQPDGDLEVFLRVGLPALPVPWQPTADPRIWRLPGHEDVMLDEPTRAMPNPNPAIVQLGTTQDGAEFYIDLEAVGVLAIGADDDTNTQPDAAEAQAAIAPSQEVPVSLRGIARAVTVTLATSPLAGISRIRTIGFDPFGLADEERIHAESSVDELVEHATTDIGLIRGQMNDRNIDSTLTLRVRRPEETWDPTIAVVADRHLSLEHAARLVTLAGNGSQGMAVILPADAAPSATWRLVLQHVRPTAESSPRACWRLDPLGVVLAPMSLAADELEDLAALLDEADTPPVTPAPDEPGRQPDASDRTVDLPDGHATGPVGKNGQAASGAAAGSSAIPRFAVPDWRVMVRLLGPVDVIGRDGAKPTDVRERTLETLAWLVLHRRNGTRAQLESALWPTGARAGTVSNTLSRARAALEELAGPEAHAWIPGHHAGLDIDRAVTSDLEQLQARLAFATRHRDDPQTAISVLRDGLALVRGVPAGYAWLDAELGSTLTITPTTAAILLAEICLEQGDLDGVLEATEAGLAVLPAHPELFAVRMKARAAAGDRRAVRAEYEAYLRAENADPMADGETDRDLERLYLDLIRTSAR